MEGIQRVLRSRQYSRRGSDSAVRCGRTLRIDQIVDTNRSRRGAGVHVYNTHLLDNRSTSSSVCKAGALVPPPSCLGGGPHGWVPVDTHSTPVLTSVRRLWVACVVQEPNTPQEHAQPVQFSLVNLCVFDASNKRCHFSAETRSDPNLVDSFFWKKTFLKQIMEVVIVFVGLLQQQRQTQEFVEEFACEAQKTLEIVEDFAFFIFSFFILFHFRVFFSFFLYL